MAKARAIIKRLKGVRNVRKITRTMELVATARFKKAMDRATQAAAYTRKISEIVADLSAAMQEGATSFQHPLLQPREIEKKSILLVITSNRGLCGGYNGGVIRHAQTRIRQAKSDSIVLEVEVSGKRGIGFFKFQKVETTASYTNFEDKPTFAEVDVLAKRYVELFVRGEIDRLDVAYTRFETMARQKAVIETLLPIGQLQSSDAAAASSVVQATKPKVEYDFLPSPQEILEEIVPASFKARLFKCFLDAAVSEQIARMVAMKSATSNADDMIRSIRAQYNRARQSQITSELSEIIGGAAALE
ncbi:ATP synthase F1 subunit gamma [Schlesneria paludicola]|uniref:ATP synthase F1 subunit gamma n=1 Tax=Schlesneria paludicola TaxID=360056 RepID=UPI00029AC6A7|nr:ATP synthase F1 subunit gamma [Schlesneria paludicola]